MKDTAVVNTPFVIKSYYRKDLQLMYGVPEKTFHRWLKPFSEEWKLNRVRYLNPMQVQNIINQFGIPPFRNFT